MNKHFTNVVVNKPFFDRYFQEWMVRFRSTCPTCGHRNKHGRGFFELPRPFFLNEIRGCHACGKDYQILCVE